MMSLVFAIASTIVRHRPKVDDSVGWDALSRVLFNRGNTETLVYHRNNQNCHLRKFPIAY